MDHSPRTPGLPAPAGWILLFAAVLALLPAVGFDFAGADFDGLARAAGITEGEAWPPFPWSQWATWHLAWPLLGLQPAGYHVAALVAMALLAWATARLAARIGAGTGGAALAGLFVVIGPCAWPGVAWVSASAEIWSMLFTVAALDLWIDDRQGARPLFGAVLAALAASAAPSGSVAVLLLACAPTAFGIELGRAQRRARRVLLLATAAVILGAIAAQLTAGGLRFAWTGSGSPSQFLQHFADASWPLAGALRGPVSAWVAAIVLTVGTALAVQRARARDPRFMLLLVFAVGTAAAGVVVHGTTLPHHGLGVKIAAGLGLALAVGPALERRLATTRPPRRASVLAVAAATVAILVGWNVHDTTRARGADGRLVDPILHMTSITADVRRQAGALRAPRGAQDEPMQVLVLQAARVELPADLPVPENAQIVLGTPVHTALRGERGLGLLLGPGSQVQWNTHLDDAHPEAFVFLDAGDDRLRMLGPVENARIYSALIAVAAGQHSRARHDLWHVIEQQGGRVRFAFDPDALPIAPEELDAEAAGFAHYLVAREEASAQRVLRLFEQIYEEIRGRELIRDFDQPLRAPRHGR